MTVHSHSNIAQNPTDQTHSPSSTPTPFTNATSISRRDRLIVYFFLAGLGLLVMIILGELVINAFR